MIFLRILLLVDALVVLGAHLLEIRATRKANTVINNGKQMISNTGLTGVQAAQMMLQHNNINCKVCKVEDNPEDSYNVSAKTLSLASDVFDGASVSDVGVACMEAGHVVQYSQSYLPAKICAWINPRLTDYFLVSCFVYIAGMCAFACKFAWAAPLVYVGAAMLLTVVICRFMAFMAEIDAGKRARTYLTQTQTLTDADTNSTKNVLNSKITLKGISTIMLLLHWMFLVLITISW